MQNAVDQWKDLPRDFSSFATLPEEYKKAVYLRLTDAERAALWQAHWQAALAAGSFSDEQREMIAESGRLWTEDTFAALRSPEGLHYPATRQLLGELKERLESFFDQKQMVALFGRIGPVRSQTVAFGDPAAAPAPGTGKLVLYKPLCSCNIAYNDCPWASSCGPSTICVVSWGCGYMMSEDCDGACWSSPPNPCP